MIRIFRSYVFLQMLCCSLPVAVSGQAPAPQMLWLTRWMDNPNAYKVDLQEAIHLNSRDLDFAPCFYQDQVLFISSRKGTIVKDRKIGESFFDIYHATLDAKGGASVPSEFSATLNSLFHEGPVCFNAAQDKVYFTRNDLEGGKKNAKEKDRLKIMEAIRGPNDWIQVQESPLCNPAYSVSNPALSADGKMIIFASDMPGGKGGMDLYFSKWENEQWSPPINLGPAINTIGNESFPVLLADNTLIFASNGLPGLGGLDLFVANYAGGYWKKVTNLGAPFNSAQDDLGFAIQPDGQSGFISSNRDGGTGKDDLYRFEISLVPQPEEIKANIIVIDAHSKQRLADAAIYKIDQAAIRSGKEEILLSPDSTGRLELKVTRRETLDLEKPDARTDINGNAAGTFTSGHSYQLYITAPGYQAKAVALDTPGRYIQILMDKEPCLKGLGKVNRKGDLKSIDMAEILLVSSCFKDTIVLEADAQGFFVYCLDRGCTYDAIVRKAGYLSTSAKLDPSQPGSLKNLTFSLARPIATEPIAAGSVIVLENIYYDFDKSDIRKDASFELDQLVEIMKTYPSMEVELIAHTDSRGEVLYNQKLSLDRALAAKKYLESKGIAAKRIRALGYGESHLRNRCAEGVECSEEEHEYNRRTEVKVLKLDGKVSVKYR